MGRLNLGKSHLAPFHCCWAGGFVCDISHVLNILFMTMIYACLKRASLEDGFYHYVPELSYKVCLYGAESGTMFPSRWPGQGE